MGAFNELMRAAGGSYMAKQRAWRLGAKCMADVRARAHVRVDAEEGLTPIPARAAEFAAARDAAERDGAPLSLRAALPEDVVSQMLPHQREGVLAALRWGGRVLLGDEMGVGKTAQGICILAAYRADWPALLVAPTSLVETWRGELLKWLPEEVLPNSRLHLVRSQKDGLCEDALVTIVSYALAERLADDLSRHHFGAVLCDESHSLKTRDAKRTRAILPLARRAQRAVLISGTPAVSRPCELFSQLHMLRPAIFPSFDEFAQRYCDAKQGRFGWDTSGRSHVDELHHVLTATVLVRRLKTDVLATLPPKTRRTAWLQPANEGDAEALAKAWQDAEAAAPRGGAKSLARDSTELTALRTISGSVKLAPAAAWVRDALASMRGKLLCFAHHRVVLDGLGAALQEAGVQYMRIDGQTPKEVRCDRVASFQEDASVRAAILSITAAGTGLTLTAAHRVVFVEVSWNASDLQQAEDRAHRIGQTRAVEVTYLLMKGSVDDIIWPCIRKKLDTIGRALDGKAGDMDLGTKTAPLKLATTAGSKPEDGRERSIQTFFSKCEGSGHVAAEGTSPCGRSTPLRALADGDERANDTLDPAAVDNPTACKHYQGGPTAKRQRIITATDND